MGIAVRLAGLGLFNLARLFLDGKDDARVDELAAAAKEPIGPFMVFASTLPSDYFDRGMGLLLRGDWEAAAGLLETARTSARSPDFTFLPLGVAMLASGRFDEAADWLDKATAASPDDVLPWLLVGFAHRQAGRPREASVAFTRAHERGLDHWVVHNEIGVALRDAGSHANAVPWFRRAYAAAPRVARVVDNLAQSLARSDHVDEAIPLMREVLALEPDHQMATANLGIALVMKGQMEEGRPLLARALEREPENAAVRRAFTVALVACGTARNQDGKKIEAIQMLMLADTLGYSEWTADQWQMRAWLAHDTGDFGAAEGFARRALALEPASVAYRKDLGIALLRLGRYPEAIAVYESLKAEDLGAKAYIPYLNIGCCHALAGDEEAALRELAGGVERGLTADGLESDSDLVSLRGSPGFAALVATARARAGA